MVLPFPAEKSFSRGSRGTTLRLLPCPLLRPCSCLRALTASASAECPKGWASGSTHVYLRDQGFVGPWLSLGAAKVEKTQSPHLADGATGGQSCPSLRLARGAGGGRQGCAPRCLSGRARGGESRGPKNKRPRWEVERIYLRFFKKRKEDSYLESAN